MREDFGEASTLTLLSTHVKLLALVDVQKKGWRLGLIEFVVATRSGVEQIAQRRRAVAQQIDPAILLLHPLGIGCTELPRIEECFGQRPERLDAGLEGEEAPLAAVLKGLRPRIRGARVLGPGLALERREHTRLRER